MSNEILKHYPYFERDIAEFQKISEAESAELLSAKTQKDKILATTISGPHKADLEIISDNYNIKDTV